MHLDACYGVSFAFCKKTAVAQRSTKVGVRFSPRKAKPTCSRFLHVLCRMHGLLSLSLSHSSLPPLSPAFAHEPPKGIGCKPQLSKVRAREYKVHSSKNMSHTHVYNKDLVRRRRQGFWSSRICCAPSNQSSKTRLRASKRRAIKAQRHKKGLKNIKYRESMAHNLETLKNKAPSLENKTEKPLSEPLA